MQFAIFTLVPQLENVRTQKKVLKYKTPIYSQRKMAETVKADSHTACRAHAMPMPFTCHAVPLRAWNVSFPFDLQSTALSDSHLSYHVHATL